MEKFEKECPVCQKRFTSLIEYMTHLGKDHKDIHPDRITKMNKEEK
ncbi:MAG: hypothetical protein ACREA3_08130 [Nitrosotalea sp.]